jgi:signal transduction histidine kinase
VLNVYRRKCESKGLTVEQEIEPDLTITAVDGEVKQILSNLLSNAIDASTEGGRIRIRARNVSSLQSDGRAVRVTFADNGVGISNEERERVFAAFFTTKAAVGTGLGLWITKDLLEKRGGHIRFRSSTAQPSGTVMSFYLPSE